MHQERGQECGDDRRDSDGGVSMLVRHAQEGEDVAGERDLHSLVSHGVCV